MIFIRGPLQKKAVVPLQVRCLIYSLKILILVQVVLNLKNLNDIDLHLIGPLQTNKVKTALKLFNVIQTLDRQSLVDEIVKQRKSLKEIKTKEFFIQINIGDERQKSGIPQKNLTDFFHYCKNQDLKISGLMCIPPNISDPGKYFLEMKKIEVNERIASFYGLSYPDDANTTGFVEMNASYLNRQGLHTHPYLLASHSYPEESSPIHRGVFTARKILGRILRPPTEAVSFRNADFDPNWTMRQKVTELTKAANCMSCHDQINSTGFVLENFDATGRNRSEIAGVPLDLKVEYLDSEGIERTLNGSQDLLSHALESTKPAKSFVDELFKHLAKQPVQSYHAIDTSKLSEMLQNEQLSLRDLYSQLGFLGASDGFSFLK